MGKGRYLSTENIQSTGHQNPPHHRCQRHSAKRCRAELGVPRWWRSNHPFCLKVYSAATMPDVYFFWSYLLFLPNGTAQLHSSKRHGASFTVVPSSRTPATKTQQTWRVACSHPHDCKIPELRSVLFLPTFQLTAESCSGIFPVPLKHISSSSQTGLLYWCFDRHRVRLSMTLNARPVSVYTCNFNNAELNSALMGKPDSPGFLLAHNYRGNAAGC